MGQWGRGAGLRGQGPPPIAALTQARTQTWLSERSSNVRPRRRLAPSLYFKKLWVTLRVAMKRGWGG